MWRAMAACGAKIAEYCQVRLVRRPAAGLRLQAVWASGTGLSRLRWAPPPPLLHSHLAPPARHRERSLSTASASPRAKVPTVAPEHEAYWRGVLEGVDRPTAAKLKAFVDPAFPLGLPPFPPAGAAPPTGRKGTRRKTPPVLSYFLETKREHPTKVVLVRVGEFFETVGIDAVLLVQYAGLNPMGGGDPPRAGCPRANLRRTVADLIHAGLSVVVCEETPEPYSYGYKRTTTKERYVAQVLTPATPHLLYGLIDEDADLPLDSTPPLLGIAHQVGGFTVVEVNVELFKVTVTQGLTEDAVYARLYEGGLSPPLFIHTPGGVGGQEVSAALEPWERRVANSFRAQAGSVERYSGADPVAALVARVRQLLDIPPHTQFTVVSASSADQPRPLYYSTASNLGLHATRGVPPLLDALVPPSTPAAARAWLRQLLLFPPPPRVGAAVLRACTQLQQLSVALPAYPAMGVTNVVLKLSQKEANDIFFRELAALCRAVEEGCSRGELGALGEALLTVAGHCTGLAFAKEDLAAACSEVLAAIKVVVEEEERLGGSLGDDDELGGSGDPTLEALARFQVANESRFRGRVLNDCIPQQHAAVESAWQQVRAAVEDMCAKVGAAMQQAGNGSAGGSGRGGSGARAAAAPTLTFNSVNNAVWLKVPKGAAAAVALREAGLKHPNDRLGNAETGYYSTRELEVALDAYRRTCAEAADAVKQQLRALSEKLQVRLPALVTACMFATVAGGLTAHMHEAARRGWALPSHRYPDDFQPAAAAAAAADSSGSSNGSSPGAAGASGAAAGGGSIEARGMWPYWLDGRSAAVVRNGCDLQGLFLLTGPNMAGKSTLLRTLCAVGLLGACGLSVPAEAAAVPYIDAFMLRNFSSDSPVDGRSSFAVEMSEMRHVLSDVTGRSLVLVDELGKGTEVRAGAALAGAMLEQLAAVGCKGIFATHLHVLLDMELSLPGVELRCMEVARRQHHPGQGAPAGPQGVWGLEPTWRMVPGASRESLALEVARQYQVPEGVLARAAELYSGMQAVTYGTHGQPGGQAVLAPGSQLAQHAGAASSVQGAATPANPREAVAEEEGGFTLSQAAAVLGEVTAATLAQLLPQEPAAAAEAAVRGASGAAAEGPSAAVQLEAGAGAWAGELAVRTVGPGQDPPPSTVGRSCVYVVRRQDGMFYAGTTDNLRQRLATHRRRKAGSGTRVGGGPGIELAYVALPGSAGGASAAGAAEAAVIQALLAGGFPLLSTADAVRRGRPRLT